MAGVLQNPSPPRQPKSFIDTTYTQSQDLRFTSSKPARQWSTPLAKNLAEVIATTGPISIAAYMRQCLTSPDGGYYTSQSEGRDQFGQKGDFITSPEISQVFGELLGIWLVAEWMAQGRRSSGVELIEAGPGRGTLMADILRTIRNFKSLAASIEAVYLVEASPALRDTQKLLLCGDAPMEEIDMGFRSTSKYSNIPIIWCEDIRFVQDDPSRSPFIFAHEFFDALPIHAFHPQTHPGATIEISPEAQSYAAEFARRIGGTPLPSAPTSQTTKPRPSGAALILDYGPSCTIPSSTLRGIRAHRLVSPLRAPGRVDLSADVDFTALAHAAVAASPGVEVHGPVEQGAWLRAMGGEERVGALSP
ncbi:MAG: hypothetical protein FRX48_03553 [Lasallia pustulata]|uniref:Protein arginine methyltransferase NDUFAF7 n=1 Tax=Lasallia pustulata TaxID=136370 RepID=A0A5M8PU53_9LECA|nr:MAG: hypothetical protein FRX48_03553 [Lasallia pustulata]